MILNILRAIFLMLNILTEKGILISLMLLICN